MIAWGVLRDCTPDQIASVLRNFPGPYTVPIRARHWGEPSGWVRAIVGYGPDLWLTAEVTDRTLAGLLGRGPVPISMEIEGRGVRPPPNERGIVTSVLFPAASAGYRGTVGAGWTLIGVASVYPAQPAAPGSALWAVA